jgi:glutamate racemase
MRHHYLKKEANFVHQAIAILDSGVGGLTVAKEILRQLPQEKIIYFGDTARTPYGPRPPQEVIMFTRQIIDYLQQFRPKMIVIACNTATAFALNYVREHVKIPVVGVIHPGVRAAIKQTRRGIVGVIGTEGTIKSHAYDAALKQISPNLEVHTLACPELVPLVERGVFDTDEVKETVYRSLKPLIGKPIDCLILGCTHYPFLTETISKVMGPDVELISSADETAREVSTVLYHRGLLSHSHKPPIHQFFCSGHPQLFRNIAEKWLGEQMRVYPIVWQVPNIV